MRPDRSSDELLAAYLDGVAELTPEERRAVEARLADDDALRAEAAGTRALLDRLRELPRHPHGPGGPGDPGGEPDWAQLERSIMDAVGPEVPRPWWRRLGLRLAIPAAALAVGAAIVALVVRAPKRAAEPAPVIGEPAPPDPGAAEAPEDGTLALWLDGEGIEVELDAEELLDVPWETDHHLEDLLPPSDLAWVDELVEDELARAEALLNDPELALPVWRKRS